MRVLIACLAVGLFAADAEVEAILAKQDALNANDLARLTHAVSDGSVADRLALIDSLVKADRQEALAVVARGLRSHDQEVAVAAIHAVAAFGTADPAIAADIRTHLDSPAGAVAAAAAAYAAEVRDDQAVETLVRRLSWKQDDQAAQQALAAITGQNFTSAADWDRWNREQQAATQEVLALASERLDSSDPATVLEGVSILVTAKHRPTGIVERLIELSNHADPSVASLARAGLGTCSGPVASAWRSTQTAGTAGIPVTADDGTTLAVAGIGQVAPASAPVAGAQAGAATMEPAAEPGASSWTVILISLVVLAGGLVAFRRLAAAKPRATPGDAPAGAETKAPRRKLQITFIK